MNFHEVRNLSVSSVKPILISWFFLILLCVFIMIVVGGLTRLTDSGLSMVAWRPFTGWLPPLNQNEWIEIFESYKKTPEFLEINFGMDLDNFKNIFWLEYLHRLWGRIIGVLFVLPLVLFWLLGWLNQRLKMHCLFLFLLGGIQGGLGWYMVKSGLVDNPDVSQYRLGAHLCLALFIFGYLIWVILGLSTFRQKFVSSRFLFIFKFLTVLIFITIFSGALVAGLDAGLIYNTFPLMDGMIIPDGIMEISPWYLNLFENVITVQFDHRLLATLSAVVILCVWFKLKDHLLIKQQRILLNSLLIVVLLQVSLGVLTLINVVPIWLGLMHQSGAVILFGVSIWLVFSLSKDEQEES